MVEFTMEQMLERLGRLPEGKEQLMTREVRHVCGDVHEVTVYRWVQSGLLVRKRVKSSRGRKSFYRRGDVETFIRRKFGPPGASRGTSPSDSSKGRPRGNRGSSRGGSTV